MILATASLLVTTSLVSISNAQTANSRTPLNKVNERPGSKIASLASNSKSYKELVSSAGGDPGRLNELAIGLTGEGRHAEAARLLEHAVAQDAGNARLLVNLAIVYSNAKDFENALGALDRANKLDPVYVRDRPMRCDLLSHTGRHKKAVKCFTGRINAGRKLDAVSASNMAVSLRKNGELKDAVNILKEAYGRYPDHPTLLNNYSILLYEVKKFGESSRILSRLVKLHPKVAQYRFNLGIAQLARGNRKEAIKQYNFLKNADPAMAKTLFNLLFKDKVIDARQARKK